MPVSFQPVLGAVPFTVQWLSLQDDSEDLVVKITLKHGKKKKCVGVCMTGVSQTINTHSTQRPPRLLLFLGIVSLWRVEQNTEQSWL